MVRSIMAALLVFGLSACATEEMDVAEVDASILMSIGENVASRDRDEVHHIPMEIPVAADTLYTVADHTLLSRIYDLPEGVGAIDIYDLPEDVGAIDLPIQDLSDFDLASDSRTISNLVERLRSALEEPAAPGETPVVAENSPPAEPPTSEGVIKNSYLIQLGALPSEESARREWTRIERRHPDLIGNQFPIIFPVETNSQLGTVFRLRTGPIDEIQSARSLCRKFRSHGQDCFVTKFE